jgi:molecular chaperone DnaK
VTELKGLLDAKGEDTAALRTGVEKLASVSQKMGQAMYAQAQSASASGGESGTGASTDTGAPKAEEDVVDAEIVDDDKEAKGGAA